MTLTLDTLRQAVIGEGQTFETSFGPKPLVYADYTASGRSLDFIEDFIRQHVLPYYANTHTETSFTGRQCTALREQARETIRQALNAGEQHSLIFCGAGATAAISKLIHILNLSLPADLSEKYGFDGQIPEAERPVVLIGPYEHHSNELPWRESIATTRRIALTADGTLDLEDLKSALDQYQNRPLILGSFSAASNVTGIKTEIAAVTELLHQYGGYALWDYAAAGPYVGIDVQGQGLDAVFLSPHKFVGGPDTPGILVVNNALLNNRVPAVPGGGTVMYVTPEDHRYIDAPERREEGGTPCIVGAIRAGLVFQVQQTIGTSIIEQREAEWIERALARWGAHPNIHILGNTESDRLSICSFRVLWRDKDLHYGFVVALLNDLFGIQARGGCSCAGPYGHELLGMSQTHSKALETQLLAGDMILRPGWTRMNFNYFIDEDTFEYLLSAVEIIASHGWRLLPYYQYDEKLGVWSFRGTRPELPVQLAQCFAPPKAAEKMPFDPQILLHDAKHELLRSRPFAQQQTLALSQDAEALRWFVTPEEAAQAL